MPNKDLLPKFLSTSIIALLFLCQTVNVLGENMPGLEGHLTLDPVRPRAGKTIRFTYLLSGKDKQERSLTASLIYYSPTDIDNSRVLDVSLQEQGDGVYKGDIRLPKDALAFALVFQAGNTIDTNQGKGYIYPAYDEQGPVKGSGAGIALFYAYGPMLGLAQQRDRAIALFKRSLDLYPAETYIFEHHYYRLLLSKDKKTGIPLLEKASQNLLHKPHPSPVDYQLAITLNQLCNNLPAADSILRAGSRKYPGTTLAMLQWDKDFGRYDSLPYKLGVYAAFSKEFDVNDLSGKAAEYRAFWSSFLSYRYLSWKDYEKAIYYAGQINTPRLLAYRIVFLDMIAAAMLDNHSDDSLLIDSLATAALQSLKPAMDSPALYKFRNESTVNFRKRFEEGQVAPAMDLYARVLATKGRYEEALSYQEKTMAILSWDNPVFNEHYIDYLLKCGQYKTALEKSKLIFLTGNSNPRIRTFMRELYVHENRTDSGFGQWMSDMEDPIKVRLRDSLAKEQLALDAPNLTLPDLQGRQVSLASLRGKVVIIDFWSTWCTPCKAAFPTLQRAYDLYKKDTGVVFLFVDTWEVVGAEARLKLISNLMTSKNYSFPILLDQCTNLEKRTYEMTDRFDIHGLPTKLVINTRGQIQFRNSGFYGNEDRLMNEIHEMIRMARQ